jgi:hypothetical protein
MDWFRRVFYHRQWLTVFIPLAIPHRISDGSSSAAAAWLTLATLQPALADDA